MPKSCGVIERRPFVPTAVLGVGYCLPPVIGGNLESNSCILFIDITFPSAFRGLVGNTQGLLGALSTAARVLEKRKSATSGFF